LGVKKQEMATQVGKKGGGFREVCLRAPMAQARNPEHLEMGGEHPWFPWFAKKVWNQPPNHKKKKKGVGGPVGCRQLTEQIKLGTPKTRKPGEKKKKKNSLGGMKIWGGWS